MLVAIYVRVSTDRQAEQGASIDDQIAQLQDWAKANDHIISEIFIEPGASAYDDRRPIFQRMIDLALSPEHPFDIIAVHSQSRFYRDNVLRSLMKRRLARMNVAVFSLTLPLPEDENAAYLLENVMGLIDEFQSRENAKHVIRCQRLNAANGFFNGSRAPFGYQRFATDIPARNGVKKRLIIHPKEAEVVKEIFRLADEGDSGMVLGTKRIAERLNQRGESNRGNPWRKQRIHQLLTNQVYVGKLITFRHESRTGKLRPSNEWVTCIVPAIVDQETFDRVQHSLSERCPDKHESKAAQSPTLLTGLLKCSFCRKNLTLMTGKSGRYRYYRCATKNDSGVRQCRCPNLPREELELAVLEAVANRVLEPERVEVMVSELKDYLGRNAEPDLRRIRALERDISLHTERIALLYEQVSSGKIEIEASFQEYISVQQRKLATMHQEIESIRRRQQVPLKKFGPQQIEGFAAAVRAELLNPDSSFAKPYLKAIVREILVKEKTAKISGAKADLAALISQWKLGNPTIVVPSLVSNWRARSDSNARPLGL